MSRLSGACLVLALIVSSVLLGGCPGLPSVSLPKPRFDADPAAGYAPLDVQFVDQSLPGTSPIEAWSWSFGDGETSTEASPAHMYHVPGEYTVSLTVTSAIGSQTREATVTVTDATTVNSVGPTGLGVEAGGAKLTIPQGAFQEDVTVGIAPGQGDSPVAAWHDKRLVSHVFTIMHDHGVLPVGGNSVMTLELPFFADEVPNNRRNGNYLQLVAKLEDGLTLPVPGTVEGTKFVADITGLPSRAVYAVAYCPGVITETFDVDDIVVKNPTRSEWRTNAWRLCYRPMDLQWLTALRLGDVDDSFPYNRPPDYYSQPYIDETLEQLRETVAEIHVALRDAHFTSPALAVLRGSEFSLIFDTIGPQDISQYGQDTSGVFGAMTFGGLVIDPLHLIAISKANGEGGPDQQQEIALSNVFAQLLFRAVFRGYDYPAFMRESATDLAPDGGPKLVPFYQGMEDAIAVYAGQILSGIETPRSMGANEYSLLSERLFAPWSGLIAGYSHAGQDFLFYVKNRFMTGSSLDFLGDPYEGVLELMRINMRGEFGEDYDSATAGMYDAFNTAFERFFGVSLPRAYWAFARNRGFENGQDAILRPSDRTKARFTFNDDVFDEDSVYRHTFTQENEVLNLTPEYAPMLDSIPPLTTRAVVLTQAGVSGDLTLTVNAYEWVPDAQGKSMRVKFYGQGHDGVELTAAESRAKLPGFGSDEPAGYDTAVILVSNESTVQSYSPTLSISKAKPGVQEQATGYLGGQVSEDYYGFYSLPLPDVTVTVRSAEEGSEADLLGTKETNLGGWFAFAALPTGAVTVTFEKAGYTTVSRTTIVVPGLITPLYVQMEVDLEAALDDLLP